MKLFKRIKFFFFLLLAIILGFIGYICYDGYQLYLSTIKETPISSAVNKIKNRSDYVKYSNIPQDLINATVAIEDHRFYEHTGFDIVGIIRAIVNDFNDKKLTSGGSTITQQLVKNMYFKFDKKFSRKVAEVLIAYELEIRYSKEEILTMYLNVIYYGDGHYGIYDAANGYFNKDPKDLSFYECTLLAGIPNAPSVYCLSTGEALAKQRRIQVINAMKKYGYLDKNFVEETKNE